VPLKGENNGQKSAEQLGHGGSWTGSAECGTGILTAIGYLGLREIGSKWKQVLRNNLGWRVQT
jgi:hypothetical protein